MSVKVIGAVWKMKDLTANERLVLLALADHAHHDGSDAHPGNTLLEEKTCLSERAIQYILRQLKERGFITLEAAGSGRGHRSSYSLASILKGARGAPLRAIKGANHDSQKVQAVHPSGKERVQTTTIKGANGDSAYIEQPSLTVLEKGTPSRAESLSPDLTPIEKALCDICRYNPERGSPMGYSKMKFAAGRLSGETPERIRRFGTEWKRQRPTFSAPTFQQVCDEWFRILPDEEVGPPPASTASPVGTGPNGEFTREDALALTRASNAQRAKESRNAGN